MSKAAAVALLLAAVLWAAPSLAGRSLYVWSLASTMTDGRVEQEITDDEEQKALIRFCTDPAVGVDRLYFLVNPNNVDSGSLATFLRQAKEVGIQVFAVPRGSIQNDWIRPLRTKRPANHLIILVWTAWIQEFNREHPEIAFTGINLDVEPHRASPGSGKPLWKKKRQGLSDSKSNRRIALEYLDLLDRVRAEKGGLTLAVTIPTWYDGNDQPQAFRIKVGGDNKSLAAHIQDRVDFVTLMGYTDATEKDSKSRLIRHTGSEIDYGPAEILLETERQGRSERKRTLYEEGEKALLNLERYLEKKFGKKANFLGTGIHHYLEAYGSGGRKWPAHGGSRNVRR